MDLWVNILLVIFIGWFAWSRLVPVKGIQNITAGELKEKMKKEKNNVQYVDVRTVEEFNGSHIKGFKNIPLHLINNRSSHLNKDKEVVLVCRSGMRSMKAGKLLKKLGFSKITNVKGGMSAW